MPRAKKQRTCIFCSRQGNITKEHFWPAWLAHYFPKGGEDRYISELYAAEVKNPKRLKFRNERQGKVITKKIRVVCSECNNGWMSALEEKVKPIIASFLIGHFHKLNKEQITNLSFWVAVKAIVGEHAEDQMALTPNNDRYLVWKSQVIPEYFNIFVGIHSSETKAAYVRHSTTVSLTMGGLNPPLPLDIRRNLQTVSFLVGPLFFHVIAARVAGFNIENVFNTKLLVKLWPMSLDEIDLFQLEKIDDVGLSNIVNQLDILISSPMAKYAGPLPENL